MAHGELNFWQRNLAALQKVQPGVAECLERTVISTTWKAIIGTDGTPAFCRQISPGVPSNITVKQVEWLGGTSMPRASAQAMTANFVPGTGNGLAAGIGTGYEWLAMLDRLATHQMLFILEDDPEQARLALTICDLSAALATRRLILLAGTGAADELLALLKINPGIDPPQVIHPLPSLAQGRKQALIAAGEQIIRQALAARTAEIARLAAAIAQSPPNSVHRSRAAVAFSLHSRHAWDRPAHAAWQALHQPVEIIEINHHQSGGLINRMQKLNQHRGALVICDFSRRQLGNGGPSEVPLAAPLEWWIDPAAGHVFWADERLGPQPEALADRVVCHSLTHARRLEERGWPAEKIAVVPLATPIAPADHLPESDPAMRAMVALIGELPTINPNDYGITLPTHVAVWNAARNLIFENPLAFPADAPADLLRRAQARVGVAIDNPGVVEPLQRGFLHVLAPACMALATAALLHEAGVPIKLIGDGWNHPRLPQNLPRRPMPAAAAQETVAWNDVAVVLELNLTGAVHPGIFSAALHGVAIAAVEIPEHLEPGGLTTLLAPEKEIAIFAARQFVAGVKALLRDGPRRKSMAALARQRILAQHSWQNRTAPFPSLLTGTSAV